MRKKPKFLVVLASAIITFGTLMATIGPRHFEHFKHCNPTECSQKAPSMEHCQKK